MRNLLIVYEYRNSKSVLRERERPTYKLKLSPPPRAQYPKLVHSL